MPYRRRRGYRRRSANYTWTPWSTFTRSALSSSNSIPVNTLKTMGAIAIAPGRRIGTPVSPPATYTNEIPDRDVTLERIRGEVSVVAKGITSSADVQFLITGAVLPKAYAHRILNDPTEHPNPLANDEFDDYVMFNQVACVPIQTDSFTAPPFQFPLDVKAKRKVPVGDVLVLGCHVIAVAANITGGTVICTALGRVLSKLKV